MHVDLDGVPGEYSIVSVYWNPNRYLLTNANLIFIENFENAIQRHFSQNRNISSRTMISNIIKIHKKCTSKFYLKNDDHLSKLR